MGIYDKKGRNAKLALMVVDFFMHQSVGTKKNHPPGKKKSLSLSNELIRGGDAYCPGLKKMK